MGVRILGREDTWEKGYMGERMHGREDTWERGYMGERIHGREDIWERGYIGERIHGREDTWERGYMGERIHGREDTWEKGYMGGRIHGREDTWDREYIEERINVHKLFVGDNEEITPFGIPRHNLGCNGLINVGETRRKNVECICCCEGGKSSGCCEESSGLPSVIKCSELHNKITMWRCDPTMAMASSFFRFLDHTQRRTTVGRTPLDE